MLPHCFLGIGNERTVLAFELELLALEGADGFSEIVLAHLWVNGGGEALMMPDDAEHLRGALAGIVIHLFNSNDLVYNMLYIIIDLYQSILY